MAVKRPKSHLIPPETELLAGGTGGHGLEAGRDLGHVIGLPVLRVDNDALALEKYS